MEQSLVVIKADTLGETFLRSAQALRENEQFVDFTVIADGTRFAVHKLILVTSSDFFKAMLQHPESRESRANECHLKDVSAAIWKIILDFCYTSQIAIDMENVKEILLAASVLQMSALQSLCVGHIVKLVNTTNCLRFLILADCCNLPILFEAALKSCLDHFETISEHEEFLQLDAGLLVRIISHDRLFAAKEEIVLAAIMKWIAAVEDRVQELDKLVAHVRFVLFDTSNLVNLSRDTLVLKSDKYRRLVDEAKDFHLSSAEQRSQMVGKRFEPRCSLHRQRIFAVGGWTSESGYIDTAERYDPYLNKWVEIKSMSKPRGDVGVSILNDYLYVVGGNIGGSSTPVSSVECYNIKESFWRDDVAEMKFPRSSVGVCAFGGHIYAIGGRGADGRPLDVVERYDPRTNRWEECARLGQKKYGTGVAVCNGFIYVIGGGIILKEHNSGPTYGVSKIVERFNASTNTWSIVSSMSDYRRSLGCTTFGGKIYAVGGCDGASDVDTAECYDPVKDVWEPIPPMNSKRSYLGLAEMNGLLYAVGGRKGAPLKLVEAYDPVKKQWTTECSTIYPRNGGGLAAYSPLGSSSGLNNDNASVESTVSYKI